MQIKRKLNALLVALDKTDNSLISQTAENKKISYAPWSRQHFSKRLATFWSFPFHAIQSPVNAVAWAKHGWVCAGQTALRCELCHRQVNLGTADVDEAAHVSTALMETAHAEGCCWRKKSCDQSIMKLPLADQKAAWKAFNERIQLLENADCLPTTLKWPNQIEDWIENKAKILSLFGWTCEKIDGLTLLVCTACHRRIGHWSFKSEEKDVFDVISEHRDYCPWINPESQSSTEPGWEILYRLLLRMSKSETLMTSDAFDARLDRLRENLALK